MISETGNNPSGAVRYSQQDKDMGEAKNFPWEHPVPRNAFWDDLPYTVARNFLDAFTTEELRAAPISPDSTESKEKKLLSLATWLGKKMAEQEELRCADNAFREPLMLASVSYLHLLAGILLDRGQYAEAESTERKVEPWLVEKLGKDSPQALSVMRIIILALWKQGTAKHTEAQKWLQGLQDIVNNMGSGKYAVYQDEEKHLLKELISRIDRNRWAT
ncbi:hypothetical protein F4803DRAFT_554026 [Xylaria telfairii]|nr:hypothetical protein F4803DRAFT_554026 [Xylaria telfairii]